jgi:hypothetical protein
MNCGLARDRVIEPGPQEGVAAIREFQAVDLDPAPSVTWRFRNDLCGARPGR